MNELNHDTNLVMIEVTCMKCGTTFEQIQERGKEKSMIPKCHLCLTKEHTSDIIDPNTGRGFKK